MRALILALGLLTSFSTFSQDLILVMDEQFANGTFDSYQNQTQIPGNLHWQTAIGETDVVYLDIDGTGAKNYHYSINDDGLAIFTRSENAFTTNEGLVLSTQAFPDINNFGSTANNEVGTGITKFYPWSFRRGYFEMKAKLPLGVGIASAWHLFGDRGSLGHLCKSENDTTGTPPLNWQEIDIWETGGEFPMRLRNNIFWSNVLADPTENCNQNHSCLKCSEPYTGHQGITEINFTSDFHTVGMYWDEMYVIYLIDGDVYRYWVKEPGTNGHPNPVRWRNPDIVKFEDAMVMNIGTGYGIQGQAYTPGSGSTDLNGPNPDTPLPESELTIEYMRYWTFLPREDEPALSTINVEVGGSFDVAGITVIDFDQEDVYHNDKIIANYNKTSHGHFETGRNIECSNSQILPSYGLPNETFELPYAYSNQLNLIASKEIRLKTGFRAKAAEVNFPIDAQFSAKIINLDNFPYNQPKPTINHMSDTPGNTFIENFMGSLGHMINQSYKPSISSFKSHEGSDEGNTNTEGKIEFQLTKKQPSVAVYPNPTTNILNIKTNNITSINNFYRLLSLEGKLIEHGKLIEGLIEIDLAEFPGGTYHLSIIMDSNITHHKIVKL